MGTVFGSEKPLKEVIRENQRMLKKAIRELEKEITTLKRNETKLVADIKKMAKQNQMVIHTSCNAYFTLTCENMCRVQSESWRKTSSERGTMSHVLLK